MINESRLKKKLWGVELKELNTYYILILKYFKWIMCTRGS